MWCEKISKISISHTYWLYYNNYYFVENIMIYDRRKTLCVLRLLLAHKMVEKYKKLESLIATTFTEEI